MSVLMTVPLDQTVAAVHAATAHALAGDGIINLINDKLNDLLTTANIGIKLIAVVIVVLVSKLGNWSFPSILMGVLLGGVFYYGGTHVSSVSDKVGNEVSLRSGTVVSAPLVVGGPDV